MGSLYSTACGDVSCSPYCLLIRPSPVGSVPFTAEHLSALNAWVFQRVPVEEAGIVPAVLEWVKLESQLAYAQRRYLSLRSWKSEQDARAAAKFAQDLSTCIVACVCHNLTVTSSCHNRSVTHIHTRPSSIM